MLTDQRKSLIADRLRRDGQVIAKTMAQELGLSEDTVRRDLREMAAEGLLLRVHGGAMPVAPTLPDYSTRLSLAGVEKQILGTAAAAMIAPHNIVFLDGGTTNLAITRALPNHFPFTIITHSPTIATSLEHHPTAEVILIGGRLYKHSLVAVGAEAMEAISRMKVDLFFLGATAVHVSSGFSTGDYEEAAIKRHIASIAKETHVALTEEKLDGTSPYQILPLVSADSILVSGDIAHTKLDPYRQAGAVVRLCRTAI